MCFRMGHYGSHRTGEGRAEAMPATMVPMSIRLTRCIWTPARVIATPVTSAGMPRRGCERAEALRSDSTAIAPLNVKALTTSPPTIGEVTPVATR